MADGQDRERETDDSNLENTFKPLPVRDLLFGDFKFLVPSYQRGYRWGPKEVEDLLDDLFSFVLSSDGSVYFLQPIVVRPIDKEDERWWEVLDGQQRLTTMLLILKRFFLELKTVTQQRFKGRFYRISYSNRPEIDFDNPDPESNLDSYHVSMAKKVIDRWVERKSDEHETTLDKIAGALFHNDSEKKVSFIWYSVPAAGKEKESIALFNRLNKGRIRLTGSELVKALFVLDSNKNDADHAGETREIAQFSLKWDEVVRRLQNDDFWFFLSDDSQAQTRMDALLTFVTGAKTDEDGYRQFQKAYDYFLVHTSEKNHEKLSLPVDGFARFARMQKIIWRGFDDLMRWYEDTDACNYIGWLVRNGISLHEIKKKWDSASPHEAGAGIIRIEDHCAKLREAISSNLKLKRRGDGTLDRDALLDIQYDSNSPTTQKILKNLLLLFNVESSRRGGNRFPFDRYEKEKKKAGWDLEHVDSQTDNNLQSLKDRINWIGYVLEVLSWSKIQPTGKVGGRNSFTAKMQEEVAKLHDRGEQLKAKMETSKEDEGNEFGLFYSEVVHFFSSDEDDASPGGLPKDSIANLTLLDAGTNRAYKNAPFPYKRFRVITRDRSGGFVPLCTKNLFLKYYSDSEKNTKQLDVFRWGAEDQESYFKHIYDLLDGFKKENR